MSKILFFYMSILYTFTTTYTLNIHENANACVDGCGNIFESNFYMDFSDETKNNIENSLVEIVDQAKSDINLTGVCLGNALLRIPLYELDKNTIMKIDLSFDNKIVGSTLHISDIEADDSFASTNSNTEVFVNGYNLEILNPRGTCESNQTKELLDSNANILKPKQNLTLYISDKWIRIDDLGKITKSKMYHTKNLFNLYEGGNCSSSNTTSKNKYLYIGLNRLIDDFEGLGNGLCSINISMINCESNDDPDLDVNLEKMFYKSNDNETIQWVEEMNYLQPALENLPCSAEAVVKLKFDPNGMRKIARFDLSFGDIVSGFTFNIGDSVTNNAYGGDAGTTSNSAEVHSNDNRFYVWVNPKYCGDTLLHQVVYDAFMPYDNVTIFVSDQRIEIDNKKGYHETYKSPYLYNLNGQNVTCNCYDTRCYPGVQIDNDLYFGMNRVIGGTFRPGVGLCNAKITWLQCKAVQKQAIIETLEDFQTQTEAFKSTTVSMPENTTVYEENLYDSVENVTLNSTLDTNEQLVLNITEILNDYILNIMPNETYIEDFEYEVLNDNTNGSSINDTLKE